MVWYQIPSKTNDVISFFPFIPSPRPSQYYGPSPVLYWLDPECLDQFPPWHSRVFSMPSTCLLNGMALFLPRHDFVSSLVWRYLPLFVWSCHSYCTTLFPPRYRLGIRHEMDLFSRCYGSVIFIWRYAVFSHHGIVKSRCSSGPLPPLWYWPTNFGAIICFLKHYTRNNGTCKPSNIDLNYNKNHQRLIHISNISRFRNNIAKTVNVFIRWLPAAIIKL